MNIYEGLYVNDLKDVVKNFISIDEYESKIKDDALVIAFFVDDDDPAWDLSKFIEKSSISILDAEKSPAPNNNGNYLVFVEFLRNNEFLENFDKLLYMLKELTNIDKNEWKIKLYKNKKAFSYDKKTLEKKLNLSSKNEKIKEMFSKYSNVNNVDIKENILQLNNNYEFDIINNENINENLKFDLKTLHYENNLKEILGKNWNVFTNENNILTLKNKKLNEKINLKRR